MLMQMLVERASEAATASSAMAALAHGDASVGGDCAGVDPPPQARRARHPTTPRIRRRPGE
jgi:hypothetical protein